jgi:ornithine cyclodeaminase
MTRIIGPEVEPALTWQGILAALRDGHLLPRAEIRDILLHRGTDALLTRAAWIDGLGQVVKCATVFPGNAPVKPTIHGAVNLFDDRTGELSALIDFHLVTRWKTAGDSLLAASRLARPDARNILLVGAGAVGRSMHAAYRSLWPDAAFRVWSRSHPERLGLPVATDLKDSVGWADIICTATMATEPLIHGDWLRPSQHLDLIGAYGPGMREVDDTAMRRARVFVDSRATTLGHIGELMDPIASGAIAATDILADFYDDPGLWSRAPDDITIAKNGGGAHLDLMTADWIVRTAE